VFLLKIYPERKSWGTILPEREAFPYDEAFGYWGWTFYAKAKLERFRELEKTLAQAEHVQSL